MAFAGVDLPDNIGAAPASDAAPSSTPDASPAPSAGTEISTKGPSTEAPSLTDLDKLDRFRFDGREWSKKDFQNAYLRQKDYTQKTQELAEARKYVDNFSHDLRTVMKDRSRFAEFQKLYPKEYVERAQEILRDFDGSRSQSQTQDKPQSDNAPWKEELERLKREEIDSMKNDLNAWKREKYLSDIEKNQKWLDSQYDSLSKKYPFADKEIVNARAEVLASQHKKEINAQVLEKLFQENDAQVKARFESHYKERNTKQIAAGKESRDIGAGGGVPTEGPKGFKTIKEATAAFLDDINAGRRR